MNANHAMFDRPVRLGTRKSELALWQANYVKDALEKRWGRQLTVELVKISTRGDEILDRPLYEVGGKGLFVKGLEDKLLAGEIDLAVHSMKDLPGHLPEGLVIACTPVREDPRDVLVGPPGANQEIKIAKLPPGTRVGTGSLRRKALIARLNSGIDVIPIRGNVQTRMEKIVQGEVDYVVLANAGLRRLGLEERIVEVFETERFCPAACQGILALETRVDDVRMRELLLPLNDAATASAAAAERSFLVRLEGGCQVPMACHAALRAEDVLSVNGLVSDPSGRPCFMATKVGAPSKAEQLGLELAETLLRLGASRVLGNANQVQRVTA
jgi:hydroxymethylbilane synthase